MCRSAFSLAVGILLLLLCALPRPAGAAASYDTCKGFITSLPAIIDTAGTWCLNKDLSTASSNGTAIAINSDNVTIDCNGYKLGGLAAGEGTLETGIGGYDRRNITVRHCNIRGFSAGISLNSSNLANGGHRIEDNRFDGNTGYAIIISGDGSLIRNNQVNDTGFVTLNGGGEAIYAYGWIDVINNTVAGVHGTSTYEVRGIETEYDNGSIVGNRVSGLAGNSSTYSTAIFAGSSHGTIRDNNVTGTNLGYNYGLYCSNNGAVAKDNVVNHVGTGISNCSDAGGNDVAY